jgi:hypothetical protein
MRIDVRILKICILAGAGIALSSLSAFAQVTTRIETRPAYGATVTLEHGVRVYRPLPPQDRVIINPGGKTPLLLNIGEGSSYSQNYGGNAYGGDYYGPAAPVGGGAFFPRDHRPHGGHRGH